MVQLCSKRIFAEKETATTGKRTSGGAPTMLFDPKKIARVNWNSKSLQHHVGKACPPLSRGHFATKEHPCDVLPAVKFIIFTTTTTATYLPSNPSEWAHKKCYKGE